MKRPGLETYLLSFGRLRVARRSFARLRCTRLRCTRLLCTRLLCSWCLVVSFSVVGFAQGGFTRISTLADSGKSQEALRELDGYLRRNPDDERARFLQGVLLAESGDGDAAKMVFEELLASFPESPDALNNLAVLYAADNLPDRAIEILEQALAAHPSYGTVFLNLRRVYGSLASDAYRQALSPESAAASNGPELELVRDWTVPSPVHEASAERETLATATATTTEGGGVRDEAAATSANDVRSPVETRPVSKPTAVEQVENRIHAWAKAWSAQDVAAYLSFYSSRFVPDDGMTREAWKRYRGERIETPDFIRVRIADLEIRDQDGKLEAWFTQRYESDRFRDVITKYLSFEREDGAWVIAVEGSSQ